MRSGTVVRSLKVGLMLAALCGGATAATPADDVAAGLQWRLLGPFRGGWSTAVQGIPDRPDTFYFGAAGGGVWRSTDAGATWQPIFDAANAANIGALAIAPGDANVIYVGTGQVTSRYDIASGDGVYKSTDGGRSWRHVGLAATRAIGALRVDPRDPNTVLAAAFGHAFGPNPERGVFRTTDGGASWTRTLFVDETTGAVDLAGDPADPEVVFASVWQQRYWPWLHYFMSEEGAQSGVYKSTDGGRSWTRLRGGGWPAGKLGRIGLAAAHVGGATRVYAAVASEQAGGLYRSDDGGAHWQRVNPDKALANGYFASLAIAPDDADVVYVMNRSIFRCDQGGARCTIFKGAPGGDDYHQMWINPRHPDHMVVASDQGTVVSVNGGRTWSDWYNQPTGQFYHLAADRRFPYWIYSGQQDSGTVGIASRSDYGALGPRDWHPVGGDERDYDIPDPADPDIVYGSGLGGRLSRWDARTGEVQNVTPWPVSSYGQRPTEFTYRYSWITPIAISTLPPFPLYQGAQVLFRSLDHGASWTAISPDLSAKSAQAAHCEGELAPAAARACGYGVIWSIGLSPRGNDEIWIGTDDGLIRRTRDGGAHWDDVTPRKLVPAWAKIASVEVSAPTPGSVYIAVDNHRQDDSRPRVLRSRDDGVSWTEIDAGLPAESFVDVVRADPVKSGLLYAGTDRGVFVSFDDGDHWQSLQRNLPPAWVRDLLVHGDDLIAATQGRAIWVLDDVTPLRQHARVAAADAPVLFDPAPAVRVRGSQNKDTPPPADSALGRNPPTGAIIDYWLPHAAQRITLEVRDKSGTLVRRFASDAPEAPPAAERYFAESWIGTPAALATDAGAHRFVWNLRGPRPRAAHYDYSIAAVYGEGTPIVPEGMLVPPGEYTLSLGVDGSEVRATLTVLADPRVPLDAQALAAARAFATELDRALERDYVGVGELKAVEDQLTAIEQHTPAGPVAAALVQLREASKPLRSGSGERSENLDAIGELLATLAADVEGSDRAPTAPQRAVLAATEARLERALARWDKVKQGELARLNAALRQAGAAAVTVPAADAIRLERAPESKELP
jgi:photosystem II stability/assembly factor-like uncharacterized protein